MRLNLAEHLGIDVTFRPSTLMTKLVDWSVGGLENGEAETNEELGGQKCLESMSFFNRFSLQIISLSVCLYAFHLGRRDLSRPVVFNSDMEKRYYTPTRRLLLVSLTVVFGMQMGYKLMRRLFIFMLCPCHMNTLLWMFVLAAKPGKWHGYVREFGLHVFHGQVIALLFPTDHWLDLPFEKELFWIQHALIAAMPFITLVMDREYYRVDEKIIDWNWYLVSYGVWIWWHCFVCHLASVLTLTNVGHMLCPARTDPFAGPFDKHGALLHQVNSILMTGTLTRFVGRKVQNLLPIRDDDSHQHEKIGLPQLNGKA